MKNNFYFYLYFLFLFLYINCYIEDIISVPNGII